MGMFSGWFRPTRRAKWSHVVEAETYDEAMRLTTDRTEQQPVVEGKTNPNTGRAEETLFDLPAEVETAP